MREGPGRTFTPVDTLEPGTIVEVIGRDATGEWIQVRLDDGLEGWVSAGLLLIEEPEIEPTPTQEGAFRNPDSKDVGLARVRPGRVLQEQPESTPEAVVESTPEVTPEIVPQAMTVSVVAESAPDNRQERWYGMTMGLAVIIVLIAVGAVVNILRAVFGRGRA